MKSNPAQNDEWQRTYDEATAKWIKDVDENGTTLKVSLEKMLKTKAKYHWPCVVKGEAVIDVAAFGEPVHSIDENSKEDVQKYMRMMDDAKEGKLDLSQEVGFVAGQDADSGMLYYDE